MSRYPKVINPDLIGSYPASVKSGGGYVWDEVLEYRVWCHPHNGAPDLENGNDYYHVFSSYEEALNFSIETQGAEKPLALILQNEYIDEPNPSEYYHIKEQRITEWPIEFLSRPKRNEDTIPSFFSPNAPSNRMDILRGII